MKVEESEYAPFGTVTVGTDRPDDPSKWNEPQMKYADVLRYFKWLDDDYSEARDCFNFAKSLTWGGKKDGCVSIAKRFASGKRA